MRPYIAHLMADLLMNPAIADAHPDYVRRVVGAYARETVAMPQIFLGPSWGAPGRPRKARPIIFDAAR